MRAPYLFHIIQVNPMIFVFRRNFYRRDRSGARSPPNVVYYTTTIRDVDDDRWL